MPRPGRTVVSVLLLLGLPAMTAGAAQPRPPTSMPVAPTLTAARAVIAPVARPSGSARLIAARAVAADRPAAGPVAVRPIAARAVTAGSPTAGPVAVGHIAARAVTADRPTAGGVTYAPPVRPVRVLRPFQAPHTRFGPGHRGVDLAVPADLVVHSAAAGVVSFAGRVAGRGIVVVRHADGVRTEYEPLLADVVTGQAVAAGSVLGRVSGPHGGCGVCLHWGARRGDAYFDPLSLLGGLGAVRLVPWRESLPP